MLSRKYKQHKKLFFKITLEIIFRPCNSHMRRGMSGPTQN